MSTTHPAFDLLVIGGASLDVYHLANGETVHSPGGAGLYTALAAALSGAQTGMFAPRPVPIPEPLQAAARRITWLGPAVPPDQLPSFEIAHYGGGRAVLLNAAWGGEMLVTPDNFPSDKISASIVHIAALRTAERQLNFARHLVSSSLGPSPDATNRLGEGGKVRISAGTYGKICANEPDTVHELIALCDFFFMNENEASLIFGSADKVLARPGQIIFVTLAERGVLVVQGACVTHVPGQPANELDPTGAGDTFCGAVLAHLARGEHPGMSARSAVLLAAEEISAVGPARLLSELAPPTLPVDERVRVNADQVQRLAHLIAQLPEVRPFNFTGEHFPTVDQPGTLDFFFAATLQQFGFWEMSPRPPAPLPDLNSSNQGNRNTDSLFANTKKTRLGEALEVRVYAQPMIARLEGRSLKGSDYLFAAYRRALDRDRDFLTPDRQAATTADELATVLRADDGSNPMPAFDLHLKAARSYGRDLLALSWTPRGMVERANQAASPRAAFLAMLDQVGGYQEDPLRKKSMLLALILEQRPEKFLRPLPAEAQPPVIDYHLMRACLRTGLVEVIDEELRRKLIGREELLPEDEWAVRWAAYQAIQQVQVQSGRHMGAVDWFLFNGRRHCPEMTEPECAACAIDPVCAHHRQMFQPVMRTTFY